MILFHSEISFSLPSKREYKEWIKEIVVSRGCKVGDISFLFCDDDYLLEVNQKFLQHDTYTDIITFDYSEGALISGDIMISIDRVIENAEQFQVPFQVELQRVLSHGVLHLLGYKDKTKAEQQEMRKAEEQSILLFEKLKHK